MQIISNLNERVISVFTFMDIHRTIVGSLIQPNTEAALQVNLSRKRAF